MPLRLLFACLLLPLAELVAQQLDESLLDPAYPQMRQWAEAGVQLNADTTQPSATLRLNPGDDLAAAVAIPNRILLLAPGTYYVPSTLRFAKQVVLRGVSAFQTKLILKMRGERPTAGNQPFTPWATGLLFENCRGSGLENVTVQFDDKLPPPPDPRLRTRGYVDDPDGQKNLHVVAVRFSGSSQCWLRNTVILNSGQHPLILESSDHLTIAGVEIKGTYNKGPDSGQLLIRGSSFCLLTELTIADITHVNFGNDARGNPSHHNVLINSRLTTDVRWQDPATHDNLIQACVIEVPLWHDFPPISLAWNSTQTAKANTTNLIYFCTITRDFSATRSRFSIASNPNRVYHVLANSSLKGNVEEHGPAPKFDTLHPVR